MEKLVYVDRRNTNCNKWDGQQKMFGEEGLHAMWVADMDFRVPECVINALREYVESGVYGYYKIPDAYYQAFIDWEREHHGYEVKKEWVRFSPGVVAGFHWLLQILTEENDAVIVNTPVYYPFLDAVKNNHRTLICSDLKNENGEYTIDFDDFEKKIVENNIKLFFLCNPHNPVGRVWTLEELKRIGNICLEHDVTVVSDEIHNDFILKGEHHVFAGIDERFADISVTCTSASKTFNIASMMISNIFIPSEALRRKFRRQLDAAGVSQLGILGLEATRAAYEHGEEWYQAMLSYVKANVEFAREYIKDNLKNVKLMDIEGTYLIWLDFRENGLTAKELDDLIINKAKLWLDSGSIFGKAGEGFQRINVACPRTTLKEALDRIKISLEG